MGNMLSFMDIYKKSDYAGRNGDFLEVTFELARFVRRCLDFKSMETGSLLSSFSLKNSQYTSSNN